MKLLAYKIKCEGKCKDNVEYMCIGGSKAFFYCEMHYFKVLEYGVRFGIKIEDMGVIEKIGINNA